MASRSIYVHDLNPFKIQQLEWLCAVENLIKKLHWLPVRYGIIFKNLLLVYKALDGAVAWYISELLNYQSSSRNLRSSSSKQLLAVPSINQSKLFIEGDT